jgi:hypothetical protein
MVWKWTLVGLIDGGNVHIQVSHEAKQSSETGWKSRCWYKGTVRTVPFHFAVQDGGMRDSKSGSFEKSSSRDSLWNVDYDWVL